MNKFNRNRSNSSQERVSYKVGDLVVYSYHSCHTESEPYSCCDLMAIVLSKNDSQYLIRFLDDGSMMDCYERELKPVELS